MPNEIERTDRQQELAATRVRDAHTTQLTVWEAAAVAQSMVALYKEVMVEGVHYGTIPGTDKPTLLQPGAELLALFHGFRVVTRITSRVEDWEGAEHGGEPFFFYEAESQWHIGDHLVSNGTGSANSREKSFRWRWVDEEHLPRSMTEAEVARLEYRDEGNATLEEFQFAVDKAEASGPYGKPAAYWQQFKEAIEAGTAQTGQRATKSGKKYATWRITTSKPRRLYRIPNPEICDLVNTILKRAVKRAYVDAAKRATATSGIFTQDVEDMATEAWMEGSYRVVGQDAPAPVEQAPVDPLATALSVPLHVSFPRQGFSKGDPLSRLVDSDSAGERSYRAVSYLADSLAQGAPSPAAAAVQKAAAHLVEHWAEVQALYQGDLPGEAGPQPAATEAASAANNDDEKLPF